MSNRHYDLPSLTQLASFEAAARHLSFKWAARELNVTSSAISHQIRGLEQELGVVLFERAHRQVKLTAEGTRLFQTLADGFVRFSTVIGDIREAGGNRLVNFTSTTAVSSIWLTPRLSRFGREHPQIKVNQNVSDNFDPAEESADLMINYGVPKATKLHVVELFRDELVPLAQPHLAERYSDAHLAGLARLPLIHLSSSNGSWTSWRDWFSALGYSGTINTGSRVNNYAIAIQTAREGNGVLLGWRKLLEPEITSGRLAVLANYQIAAPERFYLLAQREDQLSKEAIVLRDWLIASVYG